jgi:hypothetical protein
MDTETEERYVSLRLAHGDITHVVDLLNRAKIAEDSSIKTVLVRYCIIEYAKPFKASKGVFRSKFRRLDEESVFPGGNADHKALIAERDQRIAHGDITAYYPQLHYWSKQDIFPIVLRGSHLYDNMDKLIETISGLCDTVLNYLVVQMKAFERSFREQIKENDPNWK